MDKSVNIRSYAYLWLRWMYPLDERIAREIKTDACSCNMMLDPTNPHVLPLPPGKSRQTLAHVT
eukprot:2735634-Amphidinium_carterae.1